MSLLDQAIVDAKELTEAATKKAEEELLDRYSISIKEAVEKLLSEQDEEEELGDSEDVLSGTGEEEETSAAPEGKISVKIPMAAMDGEEDCNCADDDEEIEIDFAELEKYMAHDGEEKKEDDEGSMEDDELDSLLESLEVDVEPVPDGYTSSNLPQREDAEEDTLANLADDENKEEYEKMKSSIEQLEELNKEQKKQLSASIEENKQLRQKNKKYGEILEAMKQKMNDVNLSNAKLLYQNRVMGNSSLNERQKEKIVEQLSKVTSIDRAKSLYEILESAVGTKFRSGPKSLNEVAQKSSSVAMLPMIREEKKPEDPERARWQKIAGIKK